MLRLETITSLDRPELAPYRTLRRPHDHHRDRVFVAEGEKVVRRLLASDLAVISVLLPTSWLEPLRAAIEARPEEVTAFVAPMHVLEQLTGFTLYQGVLALARVPPPVELDVAWARAARPRFLVALDGLANADNLGGVVRTAAAFGAQAVVAGETCASPWLRRAVRSSMGAVFGLPVVEPVSLAAALRELRRRGTRCLAAHPRRGGPALPDAGLTGDCCIVLGNEGEGLRPAVLEACDAAVAAPMQGGVDSLNVASAAAVFAYEVWRQRRA